MPHLPQLRQARPPPRPCDDPAAITEAHVTLRSLLIPGLVAALLATTLAAPSLTPAPAALAQTDDGDLNCVDFENAGGFRAAQDTLLDTWPEDPHRLDANNNGIACENYEAFAADAEGAEPAWVTLGLPAPEEGRRQTPAPEPAQAQTPTPAPDDRPNRRPTPVPAAPIAPTVPPAPVAPAPAPLPGATQVPQLPPVSYRQALPADLLARVDECAVVSVSRRRLVATGCRDGHTVTWKQPRDAPNLKRTAVIRFINPLDRRPAPARETPAPRR